MILLSRFKTNMPELPEAETLVRQLRGVLLGAVLSKVRLRRKDMVTGGRSKLALLEGQKITAFLRRGKFIGLEFRKSKLAKPPVVESEIQAFRLKAHDGRLGLILWFHLGMTGRLYLQDLWDDTNPHLHLVLEWRNHSRKLLFQDIRRFGRVFVTSSDPASFPESLKKMGPEPLEITAQNFRELFKKRFGRIKSLLLNQRLVAGIGNIYADESLFRAGIHPKKRADRLSSEELFKLHAAVQEVLSDAIAQGGSTIRDYVSLEGQTGRFQNAHKVYGKEGKSCKACGQVIQRMAVAGRSSFFCSRCQP